MICACKSGYGNCTCVVNVACSTDDFFHSQKFEKKMTFALLVSNMQALLSCGPIEIRKVT